MRKRNFLATATLLLALVSFSGPAFAAFSYKEKSQEPVLPETHLALAEEDGIVLAQIGSSTTEKKHSQGDHVLLPLAIELISPNGWQPVVETGLRGKKVSWQNQSDGDWVKTLENMGETEGLRFVINWKSKEIAAGQKNVDALIKEVSVEQPAKDAVKAAPEGNMPKEPLVARAVKVASFETEEEAVTVAEDPWELMAGSLKAQLTAWTKRVGYSLIWDNEYDYQLEAGQIFYGEFEKAVSEVITTLYRNGARIKADIYTKNKVLYVSGGPKR